LPAYCCQRRTIQSAYRGLAHKLFGKNDPIGRRFRLDSADGPELQIVGMAKQEIYTYWAEPALEAVWTPFSQDYSSQMYVEMRTAADPAAFADQVEDCLKDGPFNREHGNRNEWLYTVAAAQIPKIPAPIEEGNREIEPSPAEVVDLSQIQNGG
jgi:hypothetical protein